MKKILYISLTGMGEALGKSQVLEYLIELAKENEIYLISYEREDDKHEHESLKSYMKEHNINWHFLMYSNKFGVFSTLTQLFLGMLKGSTLIRKHKINIVHARSMIPALLGYGLKYFHGVKLLFDIRDFSTDEKVDRFRIKKDSIIYKILMYLEELLYEKSDFIVALTYISKDILHKKYAIPDEIISVIPTCANNNIFFPFDKETKNSFKLELGFKIEDKIIVHSGSVTGWYMFEEEVQFVKKMMHNDPLIKFIILNRGEHEYIKKILLKYEIKLKNCIIDSVSFYDVNKYLNIADASIYFIRPTYSKKAAAPTKFAELVACNIPSITNTGIGDMEMYFNKYNVGYLLDVYNINSKDIDNSLELVNQDKKDSFDYNKLFNDYFDTKNAIKKYEKIYEQI